MKRRHWFAALLVAVIATAYMGWRASNAWPPACRGYWPTCEIDSKNQTMAPIAWRALKTPETAILFSLEPKPNSTDKSGLYGYEVLGKAELTKEDAAAATHVLGSAILAYNGGVSACFNPRHILRITSAGHVYDFLTCFQCQDTKIYQDGEPLRDSTNWVGDATQSVGLTGSPKVFNDLLSAAGIQLPTD